MTAVNLAALGFGGIDTSNLVTSLVGLEQQPITTMQTNQQQMQAASTTLSQFSTALSSLKTAAMALSDPTSFGAMKASSSDSSVAASATGTPLAGQWSVSVQSLAQGQRTMSNGSATSSDALGLDGTFEIAVGGTSANIAVSASDSLTDIASKVSSAGLRVQASVLYDGSKYHLLISGLDTGSSNAITFDESGLTASGSPLGLSDAANTIQPAQDAHLTVGGVPVTSTTNQVANAIPGVTLAVTQTTTTTPTTVTIAGDTSTLANQVQSFVSAYNAIVSSGHGNAGYGTNKAPNTLLQGDQGIETALDQLSHLIGAPVSGTTGAYTTLGSVGVALQDDGTLSLDSTKLTAALQADPTSVQRLFVTDANTGATGIMSSIGSAVDTLTAPTSGVLQAEINGYGTRIQSLTTRITDAQTRLTAYQTQLQNQFNQMNTMLAKYKQQSSSLTSAFNASSSSSSSSNSIP